MRNATGAQAQDNGTANGRGNIAEEKIQSKEGTKLFFLDMKENQRGRFLKVTEDVRGRRDTIMIPMADLREIAETMLRMADWSDKNPA